MARWSVAFVVLIVALLAACGGSPGTSATPSPAATLTPGTYASRFFTPPVSFTVPAGWENPIDAAAYLQLRPAGSEVTGIHLFRGAVAASQDPSCPAAPEPGVGTSASELVSWLRARPGLAAGNPQLVTVGGLRGIAIDLAIADGWSASCPFANGASTVPLIVSPTAGYHWVVAGNERLRMYVLDLPDGGTLIVDVDAFDGTRFDALLAAAAPIVRSLRFGPVQPSSAQPSSGVPSPGVP